MYCLYEMFLPTMSILKGNKVDVYFYLLMGMVGLEFEKNYKRTGPGCRQFMFNLWAEKKQPLLIPSSLVIEYIRCCSLVTSGDVYRTFDVSVVTDNKKLIVPYHWQR
ncbi:hypothetical protein QTP88_009928 [Uroleucon formosanum]